MAFNTSYVTNWQGLLLVLFWEKTKKNHISPLFDPLDSPANCLDGRTLLDHKSLGQPGMNPEWGEALFATPAILGSPTCETPTPSNVWLSHHHAQGEDDAFFVWDLGCCYMAKYHACCDACKIAIYFQGFFVA